MNVQTYLFFTGRCQEAIDLYREVFGAELLFLMLYKEGPEHLVPPGGEDRIFHATVRIGETVINMSDDLKGNSEFHGFALLAHMDSDLEAERVFEAFAESGSIRLPLAESFWASRYGIVTDKFGVTWKVQS